jgi:acetyl esterase/lipase
MITGDKSNFNWVCYKFANSGMLVFNVNYRLSPENQFPEPLNDISNAIKSGMEYAKEYGGDLSRIYIAGDSAGAHLASWYAVALGEPTLLQNANVQPSVALENVKGFLFFYGIYDL